MNIHDDHYLPLIGERKTLTTSKSQVIALLLGASACFIAGNQLLQSGVKPTQESDIVELASVQQGTEITTFRFQEDGYIDAGNQNDWHYVWITNPGCDGVNFKWNNKDGRQWSLTAVMSGGQIDYFNVGTDCPYYDSGHTVAQVSYSGGQISSIAGPWDEPYTAHTSFTTQFDYEPQVCEVPDVTDIRFQEDGYIDGGNGNDWHYVWITNPSCDGVNYKWNNKAGKQWSLTAVMNGDQIDYFDVGGDCPYYASGHTQAQLSYTGSQISSIAGPWNEPYTAHSSFTTEFDFDPQECLVPEVTDMRFQEDGYIDGGNQNDWHYVWITNPGCDGVNFKWNNKAGRQWSLTAVMSGGQIDYFNVGTDCPYYDSGHTVAQVSYSGDQISSIAGPWDEPYTAHLAFTTQFEYEPSTCE